MSLDGGAARLPITIELGAGWDGDVRPVTESMFECLKPELRKLLGALGTTGKPALRVIATDTPRAVRLRVHGILQPYPPEALLRAWDISAPSELSGIPSAQDRDGLPGFPDAWLREYLGTGAPDSDLLGCFLAELTLGVVTAHPGCLIGPSQVAAFAGDWRRDAHAARPLSEDELGLLLRRLIELGTSILDRPALGQVVGQCQRWGQRFEDVVEAVFARLRPRQLTVLLHPDDRQELITDRSVTGPVSARHQAVDGSVRSRLRELETSAYFELGLRLPELLLTPSPQTPRGIVAVTVNHLPGRPVRSHPRDIARVIWAEVLRSADRLLSVEEVEYELFGLQSAFPELVEAALTLIPLTDLTRVLRGLLAEQVSVRDLRAILERLVQYATVPVDPIRYAVLDQRIPQLEAAGSAPDDRWRGYLAFVRTGSGLRNYLTSNYAAGRDRLRVLVLDPESEDRLVQTASPKRGSGYSERRRHEQQSEAIRQEVWTALHQVGDRAGSPVVLVSTAIGRQALREIVADELPGLPVMARGEIRPGAPVEPLLTIHGPRAEVSTVRASH